MKTGTGSSKTAVFDSVQNSPEKLNGTPVNTTSDELTNTQNLQRAFADVKETMRLYNED